MKDIEGIHNVLSVLKPHWAQIEEDFNLQNDRFLALASTDHDTIGRVLKAHLVVEIFINDFLKAHYGIDDLEELRLSFVQKAKLLPKSKSSAAFIRPGILQLNSVRNKFGHRLNHQIENHEISAIYEVLQVARTGVHFASEIEAIEAFAPIACAFLKVPPPELQQLFMDAFANVRSYEPENDG